MFIGWNINFLKDNENVFGFVLRQWETTFHTRKYVSIDTYLKNSLNPEVKKNHVDKY